MGFAAFDLYADGKYVDYDACKAVCSTDGVTTVPELGRGPYSLDLVKDLSRGRTALPGSHIREGVVVKLARERYDGRIGRVVLKYLHDDYLLNAKLADADATDL
jgi:hypothetical protein